MTDFSALRRDVAGPVLEPHDEGYAAELLGMNLVFTHTPEAVVGAASAADVVAVVRFAAEHGLPVHVRATGHGDHVAITDGIVVSMRRLDAVSVDPDSRIATIGGGAMWGAVVAAAAPYGLAPVTGSSPTVGAVGLLLGGGLGPLARSHGYSSDRVHGFTVVTGTGDVVLASAHENVDLFWALRGGKGGLGVVLEAHVELVELPALYAGSILFPTPAIEPVLRAWADFTTAAPDDVTTSVAIMRFPPIDQVPELLRGQTVLFLRFAYPGSAEEGERILAPLRAVAHPIVDTVRAMALDEVASIHGDPTEPGRASAHGGMLTTVDGDTIDALLAVAGADQPIPLVMVELRHVGSATHTDVAGGSAVGGRTPDFTFTLIGSLMQPGTEPAVAAATEAVVTALAPWTAEETAINFIGEPVDAAWPAATRERLGAVRARYDPAGILPYWP